MSSISVSVILPTFNRMEFLTAAVDSVVHQTYTDWEMVIADDGSDDQTRGYLRSLRDPRIQVVWLDHSGRPSVARNAAIQLARGKYLAFMDSDDIWAPNKLEVQLQALRADPSRRWSYTALSNIDPDGRTLSDAELKTRIPYDGDIVEQVLTIEAIIATPSVIAERSLVAEVGGFDDEQVVNEDYDLWLRLAMRSPVIAVAEPLVAVRSKGAAYPQNRIGSCEGWMRLYGKMESVLTDPRLRAIARQRRAHNALELAWIYNDAGDPRAARRTLREALGYGWIHPAWIWGAAKVLTAPWYRPLLRRGA